jgi:hypothetical protein
VRGLLLAVVAGGFLALSGAFGSGDAPYLSRLGYWIVVVAAGAVIGGVVSEAFLRRGWLEDRPWTQAALIFVLITPPITLLVWVVSALWFGRALELGDLAALLGPAAVVTAAMTAMTHSVNRQPPETHAGALGAPPPRFLERLPFRLRGAELLAVEAEDHYLRLHTDRGSDLILMRLSDAVAELEGIEGAQTHRSWWVARGALTDVRRNDGRAVLTLKGGLQAPVSRSYARALRQAGWF